MSSLKSIVVGQVCFLIAVQCACAADVVLIRIVGSGGSSQYILDGESSEQPVTVNVGQTVRWRNDSTATHSATAVGDEFDTGEFGANLWKDVLMDRDFFELAGGTPGGIVEIDYFCTRHSSMGSSIVLQDVADDGPAPASAVFPRGARATLLVRKSIASLSSAEIDSLRRGVAEMKSRPVTDRTSWRYWANIHGVLGTPTDPLWAKCEHGTMHFFTWHRAYLFFFEQVLREASGDPTLTLPYWDWTANRSVPLPYRANAATNSLFEQRQMNNGSLLSTSIVVTDLNTAMRQTGFGSFSSNLDATPHGAVHTTVGGQNAPISRIPTSANDPLFYAHHANVDRLWNRWLDMGGGRVNPSDAAFLNRSFRFVATDGTTVSIQVRDLLDQTPLGYRYDDDPAPGRLRLASGSAPDGPARSRGRARSLGVDPEVVRVRVPRTVQRALASGRNAAPAEKERVVIDVVGIEFQEVPGFVYGVYLNLPEGETDDERLDLHYVRSISFFTEGENHGEDEETGHGEAAPDDQSQAVKFTESVDATETLERLRAAGQRIGDELTVTLRPITPVPPPGREAQMRARMLDSARSARVTYEAIRVRVGEP